MSKSFSVLVEETRPCPPATKHITSDEARDLVKKFERVFNVIGVDFSFSHHGGLKDRLTDDRNDPPISACEFDYVMSGFIKKNGKQLYNDVADIESGKVEPRGKNPDKIRKNNYEYVITSRSTNINIAVALQPNPKRGKNKVRANIITIMRKRSFGVKMGERVMVESFDGEQFDFTDAQIVVVD